ncbi:amino acid ABC transporter permease [Butyrivibrio sp. M55]|uniref:amino acid ABC transporter permease n=1 Tax=Butyrivibrio sp. M55 TaxID=1855323 RepID=UPI0008E33D91|nr:amino acid ABC transporter permease [Butyrivibrio sp. M55]SFU44019.1 amino acid ABC transporter membrane protein, PAAT family [Butyrivibrio sp. M55]
MEQFNAAFITDDRWKLYFQGLWTTLEIVLFATILGLAVGTISCLMYMSTSKKGKPTVLHYIAMIYIDIIRGTPSVLQLLIMWFIIMKSSTNGVLVAVISFGINSGAYVSEIMRGGIQAVNKGQLEAGDSLGITRFTTMRYVILPQAFRNALPALCNEFITLLKETAIVGYVSLADLTRVANQVASRTYQPFMPLIGAAVIYFVIIKFFTILFGNLERRLRQNVTC